ncbi:MAG: hypothetical protein LBG24_07675 [Treponema sp.]|jgi:hypothetical protein|nr:hypothetical protein [Treponema sp.]
MGDYCLEICYLRFKLAYPGLKQSDGFGLLLNENCLFFDRFLYIFSSHTPFLPCFTTLYNIPRERLQNKEWACPGSTISGSPFVVHAAF